MTQDSAAQTAPAEREPGVAVCAIAPLCLCVMARMHTPRIQRGFRFRRIRLLLIAGRFILPALDNLAAIGGPEKEE